MSVRGVALAHSLQFVADMLKHILTTAVLLTTAPAVAHADDHGALCSFIKKSSADDQRAYEAIKSQLWTAADCDLKTENEYPDRYDSSVLVHVGRVIITYGDSADEEMISRYRSDTSKAAYSISKLDRSRFEREIGKAPAGAKKLLVQAFDLAAAQAKVVNAWRATQSKAGQKAVWQKGWDDAIAEVDKDWATYGKSIQLAIDAIEKASSGEECPDVRGRLGELIRDAAPKTKEDTNALIHRVDIELLLGAAARCTQAAGDKTLAALLGHVSSELGLRQYFEGPSARVASIMLGRYNEAKDRGITKDVVPPRDGSGYMINVGERSRLDNYGGRTTDRKGNGLIDDSSYGEVATKKPSKKKPGYVTLTFKKVVITDYDLECARTNKVDRIDDDGNVVYGQNCSWGKGYKRNVGAPSVDVPADLADTIKVGNFVLLAEIENGTSETDHRLGYPIELYSDKSRKQLIGFLGVRWKK